MVKSQTLGIWIPTFPFCCYHDDGFVDSVEEHLARLSRKYGQYFIDPQSSPKAASKIVERRGIIRTHYHIFYLDKKDPARNVLNRAHEETHFLEIRGFLSKLEARLLKEQGVKIDLDFIQMDNEDIEGKEIIANIGAVYALVKHGYDPSQINTTIEEFKHARELYSSSRVVL